MRDARKIRFVHHKSKWENVEVHGSCATLYRFGQAIVSFAVSPGQRRSLKKGHPIFITSGMIDRGKRKCSRN